MSAGTRPDSSDFDGLRLFVCLTAALAAHAWVLCGWKFESGAPHRIEVASESVEVALVASAPAPQTEEPAAPTPPQPEPVPIPAPPPVAPTAPLPPLSQPMLAPAEPPAPSADTPPAPKPEHIPATAPQKETPPPKPLPIPAKPTQPLEPSPPAKPSPQSQTRNTQSLSNSAPSKTTEPISPPSTNAAGALNTISQPVYTTRPTIIYPAESKAAGEQGLVVLHITVNAKGRPTAVTVSKSSGFARLDRAAIEGGWRCRIQNAVDGAQFDAPMRFSLKE